MATISSIDTNHSKLSGAKLISKKNYKAGYTPPVIFTLPL